MCLATGCLFMRCSISIPKEISLYETQEHNTPRNVKVRRNGKWLSTMPLMFSGGFNWQCLDSVFVLRLKDPKLQKLSLVPTNSLPSPLSSPQGPFPLHSTSSIMPMPQFSTGRLKSHQRSLSDAPAMKQGFSESNLNGFQNYHKRVGSFGLPRNCLGDLTSGHGFDNGCICFEKGFSDVSPDKAECTCGVSSSCRNQKWKPQPNGTEFIKLYCCV